MEKNLNLQVNADASNSVKSIEKLEKAILKTASGFEEMKKAISGSMKTAEASAGSAAASVEKSMSKTESSISRMVKGTRNGLETMSSTMGNIVGSFAKYGGMLAGIVGGFSVAQTISDLRSVDREFTLLNNNVRAKTYDNQKLMRDMAKDISNTTGQSQEDVLKALTQRFSTGDPFKGLDEVRDAAKYTQIIKDNFASVERTSLFAKATGETPERIVDAVTVMGNQLGINTSEAQGLNEVLGLMNAALDNGRGTMDQYTGQFAKFVGQAKQAGFAGRESVSLFTALTKIDTVAQAGNFTRIFTRLYTDIGGTVKQAQNAIKNVGGPMAEGDLGKLQAFATKENINDIFYDKSGNRRDFGTTLDSFRKVYASLKSDNAKSSFLSIIGNAQGERSVFRTLLADTDKINVFNDTLKAVSQNIDTKAYEEKIRLMQEAFSNKRDGFTQTLRNARVEALNALGPSLGVIMDGIGAFVSGKGELDDNKVADALAETRRNIQATYPTLMPLADGLERIIKYFRSDSGKAFLGNAVESAKLLVSVVASIARFVAWIGSFDIAGHIAKGLLALGVANSLGGSIAGAFVNKALTGAGGMLLGKGFMNGISAAGPWLIIGGVIGTALASYLGDVLDKKIAELDRVMNRTELQGKFDADLIKRIGNGTATKEEVSARLGIKSDIGGNYASWAASSEEGGALAKSLGISRAELESRLIALQGNMTPNKAIELFGNNNNAQTATSLLMNGAKQLAKMPFGLGIQGSSDQSGIGILSQGLMVSMAASGTGRMQTGGVTSIPKDSIVKDKISQAIATNDKAVALMEKNNALNAQLLNYMMQVASNTVNLKVGPVAFNPIAGISPMGTGLSGATTVVK